MECFLVLLRGKLIGELERDKARLAAVAADAGDAVGRSVERSRSCPTSTAACRFCRSGATTVAVSSSVQPTTRATSARNDIGDQIDDEPSANAITVSRDKARLIGSTTPFRCSKE